MRTKNKYIYPQFIYIKNAQYTVPQSNVTYSPADGGITQLFSKDSTSWVMFITRYQELTDDLTTLILFHYLALKSRLWLTFVADVGNHTTKPVPSITESTVACEQEQRGPEPKVEFTVKVIYVLRVPVHLHRVAFSVSTPQKWFSSCCAASLREANLASFPVNSSQRQVLTPSVHHQVPFCQLNAHPSISHSLNCNQL